MKKLLVTIFIAAFSSIAIAQVNLNDGLVGYYSLDNQGDTVAVNLAQGTDIMPNGRILNGPVWVNGISGSALQFSTASTNNVSFGTYDPSATTGQLSVSVWINWAGLNGGWHSICGKREAWDVTRMMWDICLDMTSGGIQFETMTATGKVFIITPLPPAVGEWTHVALTFDGETAVFFMNGEWVIQGPMQFGEKRDAEIHLGCGTTGGGDPFNGILDEFRVYNRALSEEEVFALSQAPTHIAENNKVISDFVLHQNYPNPFNPATTIRFSIPNNSFVTLRLFDALGKEISELVSGQMSAGDHTIHWNAENLPSGVYYCRLQTGNFIDTKKLVLLK
jgi:hypothetical protein